MKYIVLATNNKHKVAEIKRILKNYRFLTLENIGFKGKIKEDGYSFQENSFIKADTIMKWIKKHTKLDCAVLADDSGLCVKAINYEPGLLSSRYANGTDEDNRQKLLKKLFTIQDRTAYFQTYITLMFPDNTCVVKEGKCYGLITKSKIGDESFGYDCIFWANEIGKTFGQATPEEKDKVSHRAKALKEIKEYLDSINYNQTEDDDF